jgi:threonylcarbamoyladenosine tRNA methylthiotransferase MtaB
MEQFKFYIKTIGCKLNFTESSYISEYLIENHLQYSDDKQSANFFILNTCTVTGQAEKKCIQEIRSFYHTNPSAPIIVTGCFVNLDCSKLEKEQNVQIISGKNIHEKKAEILDFILHNKVQANKCFSDNSFRPIWSNTRTRCFLKIQDGCDNECAYCIVHLARGSSRSATIDDVCNAIHQISKSEVKEIVLTGLNTVDFGRINGERFINLLQKIEKIGLVNRFRISSIEPNLLTKEIIMFIKESNCFLPHFHIPLQSGSDNILKLMGRNYLTSRFRDTIFLIKELIPDAFIGIDIIAGMNGETEQDFTDSYNFVKQLPITFLHVFPYSARPNTRAVDFEPIVSPIEKRKRVESYIDLSNSKLFSFYTNNIGKISNVLFEKKTKDEYYQGFTTNYIKTKVISRENIRNHIRPILLTDVDITTLTMKGVLIE